MPSASRDRKRLEQVEFAQQVAHRGGLATRDDQCVDGVEFTAPAHRDRVGAGLAQRGQVLAGVALQRQHADRGVALTAW